MVLQSNQDSTVVISPVYIASEMTGWKGVRFGKCTLNSPRSGIHTDQLIKILITF